MQQSLPCWGLVLASVLGLMAVALSGCGGGGDAGTTTTVTTTTVTTTTVNDNCLCVYDIDRTMTGGQHNDDCENTTVKPGVVDSAYGGGTLRLSQLATHMNETFCRKCFHAVVTRGDAGGDAGGHDSQERLILLNEVLGGESATFSKEWQEWKQGPGSQSQDPDWKATSSLVFFTNDGHKQEAVKSIVQWFLDSHNKLILPYHVHFFDDRDDNVAPFSGTGYNAHQISCAGRDEKIRNIGKCGATQWEIVECPPSTQGCNVLCGSARSYSKVTDITV